MSHHRTCIPKAYGGGNVTAAQLAGAADGRAAGKGRSKPSGAPGQPKGERKKGPPGTVMGWCPNCGAEGKVGNNHDKPMQGGVRGDHCGRFSNSKELFLGPDWE